MYRLNRPTEANPHAGEVYYVLSKDNGKSWSEARPAGTAPAGSRGFFGLRTLPDGNVGAIWLEGKDHCEQENRGGTLYFARTQGDAFGSVAVVTKNVC
jgi:hypothetical protein